MAAEHGSSLEKQMRTLWAVGTVGDLDDSAVLSRFVLQHGDSAKEAFRILIERHGPMVLRICHQVLGDRHDAEDAAQAVFLVLARRAPSIRIVGSLGPWLHGVARRVAAKARGRLAARRKAELRTAFAVASLRASEGHGMPSTDDWEAVHEEVERLPEKYRAPVVLCYLEGHTYEETARQIGCPVGTVRVRLSRARDRLRDGLARRGFGPERVVLPELAAGSPDERRPGATPGAPCLPLCGAAWLDATVKAAAAVNLGRAAMTGNVSASVLSLYEGVIRAMLMNRGKTAAIWLLAPGLTVAGAIVMAAGGPGPQDKAVSSKGQPVGANPAREKAVAPPADLDAPETLRKANERLLEAARQRLDAQRAFYEEGRITIDRFNDAARQYMLAKTALSTTKDERVAAAKAYWDLMTEVLGRERAELEVGRGTVSDVAEAQVAHDEALVRYLEVRQSRGAEAVEVLKKRIETLEKQLEGVTKRLEKLEHVPSGRE